MFDQWLEKSTHRNGRVSVLTEIDGGREIVREVLAATVAEHLLEIEVIEEMGGFAECHNFVVNKMPVAIRARSGDLGEVLATEFVDSKTDFEVPIKRLRYKDDRDNPMRGDDVIAVKVVHSSIVVLKGEAKSRVSLSNSVLKEARTGLAKNQGRPNPGTLAFIQYILAKEKRFAEASFFKQLQDQKTIEDTDIEHLLFTLSGNDPTTCLSDAKNARKIRTSIPLQLVGIQVLNHSEFVAQVFDDCLQLGDGNGDD